MNETTSQQSSESVVPEEQQELPISPYIQGLEQYAELLQAGKEAEAFEHLDKTIEKLPLFPHLVKVIEDIHLAALPAKAG